jgi:hypothetical protein
MTFVEPEPRPARNFTPAPPAPATRPGAGDGGADRAGRRRHARRPEVDAREPEAFEADVAPVDDLDGEGDGTAARAEKTRNGPGRRVAGSPAGGEEPGTAGGDADDDRRWLESIPLRARLADPAVFDRQALLWGHVQPVVRQFCAAFTPTEDDERNAESDRYFRLFYSYILTSIIQTLNCLPGPGDWKVCPKCEGRGRPKTRRTACGTCLGGGFRMVP